MAKSTKKPKRSGWLKFGRFRSTGHAEIHVQESSAAFRGPCIFIRGDKSYSETLEPVFHLNYAEAVALRNALNSFLASVKNGETMEPSATGWGSPDGRKLTE